MAVVSRRAFIALADRASTLTERLGQATAPLEHEDDPTLVQRRLEQWCQVVAKGDWDAFRKRLAWEGLDTDTARRALGSRRWADETPLPAWAELLQEALGLAAAVSQDGVERGLAVGDRFLSPAEPLPFEELLAPFVQVARRRLAVRAGAAYDQLAAAAHTTLERALLAVLAGYAARALYLEFSLQRTRQQSGLQWLLTRPADGDARVLYRQFVRQMQQGGLLAFFEEYPVLARLVGTVTDLWVDAHLEFLQRLAADRPALQRTFGGEEALGPVTAVQPSLSDPHRGRRSVIALTFASGRKVVYKPKDLGTEEIYNRLLAWLNARGAPLPFRVVAVVNRTTHGWVEFVDHLPCGNQEEARRYFRRAGMLLCLVYVLEGTDCHDENLIASGEHPVLIDLETLLQHRARIEDGGQWAEATLLAYEQLNDSVLRTGLLPSWEVRADARVAFNVSGLGGDAEQETEVRAPRWEAINTDHMALETVPGKIRPGASVPRFDGVPLRLDAHGDEVVAGFRQMYRFLVDQRDALLAPDSPLHALARQQVRFVHRPTRVYGALQQKLLDPAYLRDGVDRGIQLDVLSRSLLPFAEPSGWWPIVAAEQQALEQADIPFFTAPASSDALEMAPGGTPAGCFTEPSSELMLARLRSLGDEDLARQVAFVEGALYAHGAGEAAEPSPPAAEEPSAAAAEPLPPPALVARAVAIADELRARAIGAADGSVAWIGPQYLPQVQRFQFQTLDHGLYGGACGIALFLAALEATTGGAGYRALALGALQPLQRDLREHRERLASVLGIGGAAGLGGVAYALLRTGQLLNEPALLADAERAAALITPDRIAADQTFDVVGGAAGALLGLCALAEAGAEDRIRERAVACGEHLLATRTPSAAGYRTWADSDGKLLTGFSHGAAGIAYALLRLHALTGDPDLLDAAREAIAYERSVFSAEAGNWPDFRADDGPTFPSQWCHGASGIGLARLGGLPALDTDEIRQDIAVAVETTCQLGLRSMDSLCCGNLGRVDILLAAAQRLARPDLQELASRRTAAVVDGAEQTGAYLLHPLLPRSAYDPSFFQGTAGIGYALLRLVRPDLLPCVLLWE